MTNPCASGFEDFGMVDVSQSNEKRGNMTKTRVALLTKRPQHNEIRLAALQEIAAKNNLLELVVADLEQEPEEIIAAFQGARILIAPNIKPTNFIATKLPDLKLLQTFSAGTDQLDLALLLQHGIEVANNGGANAVSVAEHAIMLMLTINHKFDLQIESVKDGKWMQGVTGALSEYTSMVDRQVGIIGLGRIGSRVARRLRGWECSVVYSDIVDFETGYESAIGAKRMPLDQLIATSDYISLHVPLDRITYHMMSTVQFKAMKNSAVLINTCRGSVVDESALVDALKNGEIWGAGLDVTEVEPTPLDNPLITMPNVVITPHLATRVIQSEWNADMNAVENAERIAQGFKPNWIVDPV